jgi:hypothetical protein
MKEANYIFDKHDGETDLLRYDSKDATLLASGTAESIAKLLVMLANYISSMPDDGTLYINIKEDKL